MINLHLFFFPCAHFLCIFKNTTPFQTTNFGVPCLRMRPWARAAGWMDGRMELCYCMLLYAMLCYVCEYYVRAPYVRAFVKGPSSRASVSGLLFFRWCVFVNIRGSGSGWEGEKKAGKLDICQGRQKEKRAIGTGNQRDPWFFSFDKGSMLGWWVR